jgi:hypothetical protein
MQTERDRRNPLSAQRYKRREAGLLVGTAAGSLLATSFASQDLQSPTSRLILRPDNIGTTISQKQFQYLGLDNEEALKALHSIIGLNLNRYRVGTYWDEAEPKMGTYNFDALKKYIEAIEQHNLKREKEGLGSAKVAVFIGPIFSPRTPEYYFPRYIWEHYVGPDGKGDLLDPTKPLDEGREFLRERAIMFQEKTIEAIREYRSVDVAQGGNESRNALADTAKGVHISREFERTLFENARSLIRPDQQLAVATSASHNPFDAKDSQIVNESFELAEILGLNTYSMIPTRFAGIYSRPYEFFWSKTEGWLHQGIALGKQVWITEAQAEPWEGWKERVFVRKPFYSSASPEKTQDLVTKLSSTGFQTILLWGSEIWYYWLKRGYPQWWEGMQKIVDAPVSPIQLGPPSHPSLGLT